MSSHITSDLDKIADSVTFIDNGKILLTGYKDEILENHGLAKCTKEEFKEIDPADYISARLNDFDVDLLISHKDICKQKYSGLLVENTNLEEIMMFYVNREKKEWS